MQRGAAFPEAVDLTNEVAISQIVAEYAGPYSTVHKGTCRGEYVAVKILRPLNVHLRSMRRKVYRERTVWADLRHPNIVPLYGYTEETDLFGPFGALISPWYHAGDASKFLKERGSDLSQMNRTWMWREVVKGVDYLHSRKPTIIHGDLKPSNVLIDDQGCPRICDFGLVSILMEEGFTGMTTTSPYTGTERYLAPELLADDANRPTTASDIWALSCIGLEFIFGVPPYAHRQHNRSGMIYRDMTSGVPPAAQVGLLTEPYDTIWSLLEIGWQWYSEQRPAATHILLQLQSLRFTPRDMPTPEPVPRSTPNSDDKPGRHEKMNSHLRGQHKISIESMNAMPAGTMDSQAVENENLRQLLAQLQQEVSLLRQAQSNQKPNPTTWEYSSSSEGNDPTQISTSPPSLQELGTRTNLSYRPEMLQVQDVLLHQQSLSDDEQCLDCVMRALDVEDVTVVGPGVWDRESDVHLHDLLEREDAEERAWRQRHARELAIPGHKLRPPPRASKGHRLTEQNLKIWQQLNPKDPQVRLKILASHVQQQRQLLVDEEKARRKARRENESRLQSPQESLGLGPRIRRFVNDTDLWNSLDNSL